METDRTIVYQVGCYWQSVTMLLLTAVDVYD